MRKFFFILALLCVFFALSGCNTTSANSIDDVEKWDYRPMIFIDNTLYGETSGFFKKLPDNDDIEHIGEILIEGNQNDPMLYEEGYSNSLPKGSKIYASESDNSLYIEIVHISKGAGYILYEQIEAENGK